MLTKESIISPHPSKRDKIPEPTVQLSYNEVLTVFDKLVKEGKAEKKEDSYTQTRPLKDIMQLEQEK